MTRKQTTLNFLHPPRKEPITRLQTFPLNAEGIEHCSVFLDTLLEQLEVERQDRLRIRLSFEESLLRLRERFGEENTFALKTGNWLGRPFIQIEMQGAIYNPLSKTETELEDWSGSLLTAVGLSPLYSYSKGKNILRLNLARKGMNAALKLLIALAIGLAAGLSLRAGLPSETQRYLVQEILMPFYDFWVRMLSVLSGPVVFLMVSTSVLNTQTIEEEGGSSKRVILRYFLFGMLAALVAALVSALVSRTPLLRAGATGIDVGDYLRSILKIVPEDVVTPLMQANTPQILLLAFVLGRGIAALGSRADGLDRLIRQGNAVGLMMTEGVSRCAFLFAAILLCMEIVSDSLQTFGGMWGILAASVLVSATAVLGTCAYVSLRKGVRFSVLLKKLRPTFAMTLRTGGVDAGFGQMERDCVERLGIERHFTTVSLPYGLVLHMPANVIGTLMFTLFAAMEYRVELSVGWLVTAMVLAVVLFVATPPVPGANLLAYIMIFTQLQIPSAALIDAMIFDTLFGIFAAAANQSLLQLDLILQADRLGILDQSILRKEYCVCGEVHGTRAGGKKR